MHTLADYRKAASLTQRQVAILLGVSQGAVSQWENGNTRPDVELIPKIADIFDASSGEIIAAISAAKDSAQRAERMYKNGYEIRQKQNDEGNSVAMASSRGTISRHHNDRYNS